MKRLILTGAAALLLLAGCGSVPLTGRKQVLLVSDQEVLSSSLTQYQDYMKSAPKSTSKVQSEQVTRVGKKIAAATEQYLRDNGLSSEIANFAWEFNLVKDDQVNAFCMPGGKIVVYEGLMKLVQTDDELAVVIGHEVAHAVAKHSNERISQQILAQYGAQILNQSLSQKSAAIQTVANQVYGIGAQYGVMLPFSRTHETEADYMGLVFMAMAGYNPDVAVGFWQKMSAGGSSSVPEFMSTHPSDSRRIADIQKALPEIKAKYGSGTQTTTPKTTGSGSTTGTVKTITLDELKKMK
ncbi:M48 family metallopeptidase [uncultured Bacteroides sp.]|uniref:M48 family metallopeptidase n=1 Tax=uncultured Bacteroides sp. TaxID=162156 RepID=UPI00262F8444|nr:M48 family metallopeptidase [uncultured Bacteroides sp.]